MSDHPSTPLTPTPLAETVIEAAAQFRGHAEASARKIGEEARDAFAGWQDLAERLLGDSKDKWREASGHAVTYVRENPGKSVLAGLGAGFVIGLLFRGK